MRARGLLLLALGASLALPLHAQTGTAKTYNSVSSSATSGAGSSASRASTPATCRECGVVSAVVERRGRGSQWADTLAGNPTAGMTERPGSIDEDAKAADRRPGTLSAKDQARSKDENARTYTRQSADGPVTIRRDSTSDASGEEASRRRTWQVMVNMEDGSLRVIDFQHRPGIQKGDKVKVVGRSVFVR